MTNPPPPLPCRTADESPAPHAAGRALPPLREWLLLILAIIAAITFGGFYRTGDPTYAGITVVAAAIAYRLRNPIA